jgi:hypothetical protein
MLGMIAGLRELHNHAFTPVEILHPDQFFVPEALTLQERGIRRAAKGRGNCTDGDDFPVKIAV